MIPVGTLVNVAAIVVGSGLGLVLRGRMTERVRSIVFQALGLGVLAIGMSMALKFDNPLIPILSLVLGGVTGEIINFEKRFERLAAWVKAKVKSDDAGFIDGMVTASLIYCIGSMAIIGAFDEGLRNDPTLLFTKAMLDGFASIAFASTFGMGVAFSAIPVFLYQYSLTLFALALQDFFTPVMISNLTSAGGMLILGIGLNLLEMAQVRISNLLPGIAYVALLTWLFT